VKYSREEFAREVAPWRGLTPLAVLSRPHGGDEICRRLGPFVRHRVELELARSGLLSFYAEDLVQSVRLHVWGTFGRVPSLEENRLRAWLRLLTHRRVVDFLKHELRLPRVRGGDPRLVAAPTDDVVEGREPAASTDSNDDPVWWSLAQERAELVRAAIEELRPRQQAILVRVVLNGRTLTCVAADLHISRWAVARDFHAAIRTLRERLADTVEDRAPPAKSESRQKKIG
jgi:RNA polymerase sigma factor (sigma-70 family)